METPHPDPERLKPSPSTEAPLASADGPGPLAGSEKEVRRIPLVPLRDDPAVSGAGRINEHQVGEVQPGLGIVHRHGLAARIAERHPPRPDRTEVEPGGVQAGVVILATRISPRRMELNSSAPWITRARPVTRPGLEPIPFITSPAA